MISRWVGDSFICGSCWRFPPKAAPVDAAVGSLGGEPELAGQWALQLCLLRLSRPLEAAAVPPM